MCILFIAYRIHPNYPLILAANRDETYDRPTKSAHYWDDDHSILAGRDLKQGGTWLGITKNGRLAALTNYRNPKENQNNKQSRGHIVKNFLTSQLNPDEYLLSLQEERTRYAGFNVIVGDQEKIFYYSNVENKIKEVPAGIHGLSNHLLNTSWPKVEKGKRKLQSLVVSDHVTPDALFQLLGDKEKAPTEQLPKTGVSLEMEKQLSPIFIEMDGYGTRSSTVIFIDKHGMVSFWERTFPDGKETKFQFHIQK